MGYRKAVLIFFAAVLWSLPLPAAAQSETPETSPETGMTIERLTRLIEAVDAEAERLGGDAWRFTVAELPVTVIADATHDRMRIIVPIAEAEKLDREILVRVMQANFDTALDARYSIARGLLWSAFVHPLGSLSDDDFLSGIGQTVNLARTFGTTFFSGALSFGGGDSRGLLERELIEELLKKKQDI